MNGEVYTLTFSKPMSKKEFMALDIKLQKEYLLNLATEYDARQIDVARMFGYSQNGFCILAHKLLGKNTNPFRVGKKPSQKWLDFIGPKVEAEAQADTAVDFVESSPVIAEKEELLDSPKYRTASPHGTPRWSCVETVPKGYKYLSRNPATDRDQFC